MQPPNPVIRRSMAPLAHFAVPSERALLDLLLVAALLSIPLIELSMRYAMCALLLVYGPMQLLRSIPYDIRVFMVSHGRLSFALLRLDKLTANLTATLTTELSRGH